jgi:hypothetical protein
MKASSNLFSQLPARPVYNCEVLDSTAAAGLVASLTVPFALNILTAGYTTPDFRRKLEGSTTVRYAPPRWCKTSAVMHFINFQVARIESRNWISSSLRDGLSYCQAST